MSGEIRCNIHDSLQTDPLNVNLVVADFIIGLEVFLIADKVNLDSEIVFEVDKSV